MIDAPRPSAPSPALGINDHNSFPTFRRYMIPEGGLVIDSSSDEEADLRRQNTIQQASSSGASVPSRTRNHSVSALSKFFVPPQSSECASLSHSIGAPLGPEIQGPAETAVGRQVVRVPRYFSPFLESCVKRGITPSSWTDEQASQQARIWRTDFPQTRKAPQGLEIAGEHLPDLPPSFPTETRRQNPAGGEIPARPTLQGFPARSRPIEATSRLDVNRKIVAGLPRIPTSPRSPDSNVLIEVLCLHRGVVKKDIGSLPEKEEWIGSLPEKEDISSLPEKEEWSGSLPKEEVAFAGRLEGTTVLCLHRGVVKKDIGSLPEKEEWIGSLPEKEDIGSLPEKEEWSGSLPKEEVAFAGRLEGTTVLCRRKNL
ncbi:hypothetical protein M5K25_012464 [Dendrobium thyrsiflorum]|uniref:Uncharacterized protein n=1 Tax=Dendrobium thyrsiflorum TaxID=117978 RepID=A0ABD0V435_DENTH